MTTPLPPYHRWAVNEDPNAPNAYITSRGQNDHCLMCGIVRWPLSPWANRIAAGPCPRVWPDRLSEDHEVIRP
jgi:hypothetical protein